MNAVGLERSQANTLPVESLVTLSHLLRNKLLGQQMLE